MTARPATFDTATPTEHRHCGNCVCWNGLRTSASGWCCVVAEERANGAEPCRRWFGLDQLFADRYGARR